jgi:flagella basal body P-ring formation protein FlgA
MTETRATRIATGVAILALVAALAHRVAAEPRSPHQQAQARAGAAAPPAPPVALDTIVRDQLAPSLPAGLDVARVYLPANLAELALDPAKVTIELPRELRAGRPSVKLIIRGRAPVWVAVAIAAAVDVAVAQHDLAPGDVITDDDFTVEHRAIAELAAANPATLVGGSVTAAIAAGAPIGARAVALPPPLSRGTQVSIEVRRGSVLIHGTGVLENPARPGEPASARLDATKTIVHGTLVAPATLIVGQ